jgi:hypothetical protein
MNKTLSAPAPVAPTGTPAGDGAALLRARQPHLVVATIGVLAIIVHLLMPERWQELSYDGTEIFILLAMLWGIRRHRPRPAKPWLLLVTGVGLLVVGDLVYNALTRINGGEVFPSVADALYIASYGALSCGVIAVLHLRRHQRDRTSLPSPSCCPSSPACRSRPATSGTPSSWPRHRRLPSSS